MLGLYSGYFRIMENEMETPPNNGFHFWPSPRHPCCRMASFVVARVVDTSGCSDSPTYKVTTRALRV